MFRLLFLASLAGCIDPSALFGANSPSDGETTREPPTPSGAPSAEALTPGAVRPVIESKSLIRMGKVTRPPEPEPAITRGECSSLTTGGSVDARGLSGELTCGQTIIGHTLGGITRFDTRFYERATCTPATTDHDGGDERVYRVHAPPGRKRLWVTLDSPCADLDLAVMRWDREELPTSDTTIDDCDMWRKDGRKREVVDMTSTGESDWLVVVEGVDAEEGAFAIHVQCMDW